VNPALHMAPIRAKRGDDGVKQRLICIGKGDSALNNALIRANTG
jgi:hypothetical protein